MNGRFNSRVELGDADPNDSASPQRFGPPRVCQKDRFAQDPRSGISNVAQLASQAIAIFSRLQGCQQTSQTIRYGLVVAVRGAQP